MAAPGNIQSVTQVYEQVKDSIAYESFTTLVMSIVFFLTFQKIYESWNKYNQEGGGNSNSKYFFIFEQVKISIVVCVVGAFIPQIFSLVENLLGEMQNLLINGFGGDSSSKASDAIWKVVQEYSSKIEETGGDVSDGFLASITGAVVAGIVGFISCFIFKWTYTVFLYQRFMWLLMLELVAPIAIVLIIHENTRTYFYTWLKNMVICYLLIPMFFLADQFSCQIAIAALDPLSMTNSMWEMVFAIAFAAFMRVKLFSVVKQKSTQLF